MAAPTKITYEVMLHSPDGRETREVTATRVEMDHNANRVTFYDGESLVASFTNPLGFSPVK